jgi:DNA-binding NtrC family response regulator
MKMNLRSSRHMAVAGGLQMTRVWEMVHSLFTGEARRTAVASRAPVVALVVNEQDRHVLANVFGQEPLDVRFAESCEEAYSVTNQLTAPVVLLDRDWPGAEWRVAVQRLSSLPHRPCVILISGVSDTYLSQELCRWRGYDVLPKPLQAGTVERTVKLALAYWYSAAKPAVRAASLRK